MKAILYKVKVVEGVMDYVHGFSKTIEEVYIPSLNISFNIHNDNLVYFDTSPQRYKKAKKIKNVDVPDDIAKSLKQIILDKAALLEAVKSWWNDPNYK